MTHPSLPVLAQLDCNLVLVDKTYSIQYLQHTGAETHHTTRNPQASTLQEKERESEREIQKDLLHLLSYQDVLSYSEGSKSKGRATEIPLSAEAFKEDMDFQEPRVGRVQEDVRQKQARGDTHAAEAADDDIPLSETEKEADRQSDWWLQRRDKQHLKHVQPAPLQPSRSPSTSPPSALKKSVPLSAFDANRHKVRNNVHWHFAALGSEGENGEVQEEGWAGGRAEVVCGVVEVGRGVTAARAMCDTRLASTNLSIFAKQTPALSSPRAADPTPKRCGSSGMFSAPSPRSPPGERGGTQRVFEARHAREGGECTGTMDAKSPLATLQVVASPSIVCASPVLADFAEGGQCCQMNAPPSLVSLPPLTGGEMEVPFVAGEHGNDVEHREYDRNAHGRWHQDQLTGETLWVSFSPRDLSSEGTQGRRGEGDGGGGGGGERGGAGQCSDAQGLRRSPHLAPLTSSHTGGGARVGGGGGGGGIGGGLVPQQRSLRASIRESDGSRSKHATLLHTSALLTVPTTVLTTETTLSQTLWPPTALPCGSGLLGPKASSISIAKNGIGCTGGCTAADGAAGFSALAGLAGGSPAKNKLSGMALMPLMPGAGDRNSLQFALDFSPQGHVMRLSEGGQTVLETGNSAPGATNEKVTVFPTPHPSLPQRRRPLVEAKTLGVPNAAVSPVHTPREQIALQETAVVVRRGGGGGVPTCSVGERSLLNPSVTAIPSNITPAAEPRNLVAKEFGSQGEAASAANAITGARAVLEAPGMHPSPTALLEQPRAHFMLSAADAWKEQRWQQREQEERMRRVNAGAAAEDNDELKRRLATLRLQADLHAREAEAAQRQENQRARECQEAQERQVALDKHQHLQLERKLKQQQQQRLHRGLCFLSNAHSTSVHDSSNDTAAAQILQGRGDGDAQGSADDAMRGVVGQFALSPHQGQEMGLGSQNLRPSEPRSETLVSCKVNPVLKYNGLNGTIPSPSYTKTTIAKKAVSQAGAAREREREREIVSGTILHNGGSRGAGGHKASHVKVATRHLHTSEERLRVARITEGNKAELDALREIVQLEPVQIREHALLRESLRKLSPPRNVKCAGAPSTPRDLLEQALNQELAPRFAPSVSPETIMVRSVSPTETCSLLRLVSEQIDNIEEHSLNAALDRTCYVSQVDMTLGTCVPNVLRTVSQGDMTCYLPQAQRTSLSPGRAEIDKVVSTFRAHTPPLSSAPKTPRSSMLIASSQQSVILEAQTEQGVSVRNTNYTSTNYTSSKRPHTPPLGGSELLQCSPSVAQANVFDMTSSSSPKDVGSWTQMDRELREKIVS